MALFQMLEGKFLWWGMEEIHSSIRSIVVYSAVLMKEFKLEPCTKAFAFVFLLPLANDQTCCSNTVKFAAWIMNDANGHLGHLTALSCGSAQPSWDPSKNPKITNSAWSKYLDSGKAEVTRDREVWNEDGGVRGSWIEQLHVAPSLLAMITGIT